MPTAHLGHDFAQRFKLITNAVGLFLLFIIFFILQYIFDMDFVCSCSPGFHENGGVYLALPPFILTWVVSVTQTFHQTKISGIWNSLSHNNAGCFVLKLVINYLCLSAVWISSVLFDGDWYFCLMTNLNATQTGIPCKENLTIEEYKIKAGHKTASLDYGLYLICALIIVWSCAECLTSCCVRKKTWKKMSITDQLFPPHYKMVYEDLLAEQVSSHLKSELTKIATERAEAICKPYIRAIGDHEQLFPKLRDGNDDVSDTVLEAWQKISASDFPFV